MEIPFIPHLFGQQVNVHLIFETLAYFLGFRYYLFLKKNYGDSVSQLHRLYAILGAVVGALIGSRLLGALENPQILLSANWLAVYKSKTIVGGLLGGLFGVELIKKAIGEKKSTGDLFVLPIMLGIFIGRIGCFLTGILEPTYGIETRFFMGMDLGDGLNRHPLALYELVFIGLLFPFFYTLRKRNAATEGSLFRMFMIAYFGFRFFIEFLKPNVFWLYGLSSIQWCCVLCFLYYYKYFFNPSKLFRHA